MSHAIPIEQLQPGAVYRLQARNLYFGVYAGGGVFIGIREKFGFLRLDHEYLDDAAYAPFNTVTPLEAVGSVPPEIPRASTLRPRDRRTGRPLRFDRPVSAGGRGWVFADTDEDAGDVQPVAPMNAALFDLLEQIEIAHGVTQRADATAAALHDPPTADADAETQHVRDTPGAQDV